MIYAKVDVKLRDHVRAHKAGAAMSTWLWALLYVREQETDGIVPEIALKLAWVGEKDARKHADTLVAVGLWETHDEGWRICRYDSKNETKAAIESRRAEARERMYRVRSNSPRSSHSVRANIDRTEGVCSANSSTAVPGSDSGSGSGSDLESREGVQGEVAPPERPPTAIAVTADPANDAPDWWAGVLETIGTGTGVHLPAREAWLRYAGHRASKARPAERRDAVHWLTTVMVKEARDEREKARHQRERDARFDRQRGGPPEPAEVPTDAEAKANAERLAQRIAERKAREAKGAA